MAEGQLALSSPYKCQPSAGAGMLAVDLLYSHMVLGGGSCTVMYYAFLYVDACLHTFLRLSTHLLDLTGPRLQDCALQLLPTSKNSVGNRPSILPQGKLEELW